MRRPSEIGRAHRQPGDRRVETNYRTGITPCHGVDIAGGINGYGTHQFAAVLTPLRGAPTNDLKRFPLRVELIDLIGPGQNIDVALVVAGEVLNTGHPIGGNARRQHDRRLGLAIKAQPLKR